MKINNGTTFVVFDMEWNQPIAGKQYWFDASSLNGEIIEIGAVKYEYVNGSLVEVGEFSCDIKPKYYTTIHYHVKKVTHKTNADLRKGISFGSAYEQFRAFCGDNSILAGWGTSDPSMLKLNLKFMGMDDKLNLDFIDVQPIFSSFAGERGKQKSVEYAVDFYNIEKNDMFHSATADARYTGEILKEILNHNDSNDVVAAIEKASVNPDIKSEYSYVGTESESKVLAFDGAKQFASKCPVCFEEFVYKIEPFRIRKTLYALTSCKNDGDFFARARLKKSKTGKYYSSAIVRIASLSDIWLLEDKKAEYDEFGSEGRPVKKEANEETDSGNDDQVVNKNE